MTHQNKKTLKDLVDQTTNPTKLRRKKALEEVNDQEDALLNKARQHEAKLQSQLEGTVIGNPGGVKKFKSIVDEQTSESESAGSFIK